MILMISDDSRSDVGYMLKKAATTQGRSVEYFSADRLDVKPCTACGNCGSKTYGRCVLPDDMQHVLPFIVRCRVLVLVTPVVFGGPGFHIKKIMDRMSSVGNPRYRIRGGELVKGMLGVGFRYCMVGMDDGLTEAERSAFMALHMENLHIMSAHGRAFLLPSSPARSEMDVVLEALLHSDGQ